MVRNLLAMTRIDAGALEVRRDWVDLREIVERASSAARRRGAAQPRDRTAARSAAGAADAKLIEQALGNVVANAVAHTPAATRIVIDAEVTAGAVALRVTDDGPGIAADMLPRMFDKFVKRAAAPARPTAAKARAWASPSPRASWRRMAGRSPRKARSPNGRGTRITLVVSARGGAA